MRETFVVAAANGDALGCAAGPSLKGRLQRAIAGTEHDHLQRQPGERGFRGDDQIGALLIGEPADEHQQRVPLCASPQSSCTACLLAFLPETRSRTP